MRGIDVAVVYGLVGLGCALVVVWRRWPRVSVEAVLLVPFWPLLAPFALSSGLSAGALATGEQPGGSGAVDLLDALERAQSTPLSALLPGREAAIALAERLETARRRVAEIDGLLALPEFSRSEADARHRELLAQGREAAASTALARAQNIGRLQELRDRWAGEIEGVGELIVQLRIQAEVVRLTGDGNHHRDAAAAGLIDELVARVEGLDAVLEDGVLHAT